MTGVSDFGISAGPGGDEEPEDLGARVRLADAVRRLTAATVRAAVDDAALAEAAAAVDALTGRLLAAAGSGQPPRRHPDPRRPPRDFFPTSPVIGLANPVAPPVELEAEGVELRGRAWFGDPYEGPPSCVHGGVIALVFDEMLGAANILAGHPAMTGTLTVRYRRPTPLRTELRLEARYVDRDGRKIRTEGAMYHGDELTAEAEGVFIELLPDRFLSTVASRAAPEQQARIAEEARRLGLLRSE